MKSVTIPSFEGRSAGSWLRDLVLGPEDESKFEAAQRAFAAMGKEVLPWLAQEFSKDTLSGARASKLAQAVYAIGPEAESLIPVLLGIIEKHPDDITFALSGMGDKAASTFLLILRHPNPHVRMRGCEQLGDVVNRRQIDREPFLKLIPDLLSLLQHDWHMMRWRAAGLIGAIRADPEQCIPALTKCLDDKDTGVQGGAALALSRYGDMASAALPRLLQLAQADDVPLRSTVISALGYFSDPRVLPALLDALKDPDVSSSAIYSLGRGKWPPAILVPALCDCVRDGHEILRWAATGILARLEGQAKEAVPILSQVSAEVHPTLRERMDQAVKRIEGRTGSSADPG